MATSSASLRSLELRQAVARPVPANSGLREGKAALRAVVPAQRHVGAQRTGVDRDLVAHALHDLEPAATDRGVTFDPWLPTTGIGHTHDQTIRPVTGLDVHRVG